MQAHRRGGKKWGGSCAARCVQKTSCRSCAASACAQLVVGSGEVAVQHVASKERVVARAQLQPARNWVTFVGDQCGRPVWETSVGDQCGV